MKRVPTWLKILLVVAVFTAAGAALAMVPSGQIAIAPHKPVDLRDRLQVDGRTPDPPNGHLFLVGVEEAEVSVLQQWLLSFDKSITMVPVVGATDRKRQQAEDKAAIGRSKEVAAAVALRMLGQEVAITGDGADISAVDPAGPAAKVLRVGDRILRFNGRPVRSSLDVTDAIAELPPGTLITLGIRRSTRPAIARVRTVAPTSGDTTRQSRIGIAVDTPGLAIKLPKKVSFSTDEIVGPSAGLPFALALYDAESDVDLLRGRYISATGALALDGTVQPVGGVRQKAISAQRAGHDLFLVPRGNVDDATKGIKLACKGGSKCAKVVGVGSAQEAVELLRLESGDLEQRTSL